MVDLLVAVVPVVEEFELYSKQVWILQSTKMSAARKTKLSFYQWSNILLLPLGILSCLWVLYLVITTFIFLQNAEQGEGTIVAHEHAGEYVGRTHDSYYAPVIEFETVTDGKVKTLAYFEFTEDEKREYAIGKKVPIYFHRDDPTLTRLAGHVWNTGGVDSISFVLPFGLALLALGILFFFLGLSQQALTAKLLKEGKVIIANYKETRYIKNWSISETSFPIDIQKQPKTRFAVLHFIAYFYLKSRKLEKKIATLKNK